MRMVGITKEDLGEPYIRLAEALEINEIFQLEQEFGGRQIHFGKWIDDIDTEQKDLVLLLGKSKAIAVAKILSGNYVYFPMMKKSCHEKIRKMIRREFDGYNIAQLAKKYGYCERHIKRIVGGSEGKKRHVQCAGQIGIDEILDDIVTTKTS